MVDLFSLLWVRSSPVHFSLPHFPKYILSWSACIRRQWRCEIYWIMLCHVTVGFLHDRRSLKSFKGHAGPKEVNGKSPPGFQQSQKTTLAIFLPARIFHIIHDWWQRSSVLAESLAPCLPNAVSLQSIFRKRIVLLVNIFFNLLQWSNSRSN